MPSSRWLARLSAPMMVGAALVSTTALAAATPLDDAFLAKARTLGFNWPPAEDGDMINMAHQICIDRWNGFSADALAGEIHGGLDGKGVGFGNLQAMVALAEDTYCPYH